MILKPNIVTFALWCFETEHVLHHHNVTYKSCIVFSLPQNAYHRYFFFQATSCLFKIVKYAFKKNKTKNINVLHILTACYIPKV